MASAGAGVPEMAKLSDWITAPPWRATLLHGQNVFEGDAGCVASVAHFYKAAPMLRTVAGGA